MRSTRRVAVLVFRNGTTIVALLRPLIQERPLLDLPLPVSGSISLMLPQTHRNSLHDRVAERRPAPSASHNVSRDTTVEAFLLLTLEPTRGLEPEPSAYKTHSPC